MNYQKHFKPEHIRIAVAETKCIHDLFTVVQLNIAAGRLDQARKRAEDILHSIDSLVELNNEKVREEKSKQIMEHLMTHRGVSFH